MKVMFFLLASIACSAGARAAEWLPIEKEVAAAIAGPKTTVVHFWAPWCANCYAELAHRDGGWSKFIEANPGTQFIFITSWNGGLGDGRKILEKAGVGPQKNFQLLVHPNGSRKEADMMKSFMGIAVNWIPATWVFREGKLRYALNYGEVRFPILQQLVKDTTEDWER